MEGTIAQVILFAGNFAPRGWAFCHGQIVSISSNQALFSLLGTTYGGDGRSNFALPDLRGRTAIGDGNGPGLEPARLGEKKGKSGYTDVAKGTDDQVTNVPTLALNYIICLQGVFPSRS